MQPKSFYGWKLVVFFWLVIVLNFCFPTFGTSVVNTYMAKAMHLDRAQLGIAFTAFSLMAGLPGPLVALCIRKVGIRPTLVAGALLSSVGAFLMATRVNTIRQAILVFGIIVGSGVALAGTIGPQVGVARWFHKKRGRAMSLLLTASGIGGFIAVPTLQRAIARDGGDWRAAWWLMSGMSLVAALVAAIFVRDSPAQMGQLPDGESAAIAAELPDERLTLESHGVYKTTEDWTLAEAFRTPAIWLLISTYLGFFMGFFIYIAHGVLHLEGLGYSPGKAAESISIVLISSMIGQTTVAVIGDRVEPRRISAVAVCLYGAGTLLAIHAVTPALMYTYAILMGWGFSMAFTSMATILSNYYGPKVYPSLLGITTPLGTTLGAIGPYLAGRFYDHFHTYSQIFTIVAVICFASAGLYLLAKPPARSQSGARVEPVPAA
ncbi:MAG TPA: MFS transporter [Candidatus Acidoferrum sp.]|nr:MFS transporter [Candidatus Acidoferrum sp.]